MHNWKSDKDGNHFQPKPKMSSGQVDVHESHSSVKPKTHLISKTKYSKGQQEILEKLKDHKSVMTKQEIQNIKNALNGSSGGDKSKEFGKEADQMLWNHNDLHRGIKITPDQEQQGLNWLKKQGKHFGYREEDIVKNFKEFRLIGFKDDANYTQSQMGIANYVPVWRVYSKDGNSLEYYMNGGEIHITG